MLGETNQLYGDLVKEAFPTEVVCPLRGCPPTSRGAVASEHVGYVFHSCPCRSCSVNVLALACNVLSDPPDDVCGRSCVGIVREREVLRVDGALSWVVREERAQKLV